MNFNSKKLELLQQYVKPDQHAKISRLQLIQEFHFFALLAACDVLKRIDIPDGETLETFFDITKKILQKKITRGDLVETPKYTLAIHNSILEACKQYYDQITNQEFFQRVNEASIDELLNGKKEKYGDSMLYSGLNKDGIEIPVIIASEPNQQKEILTKFKEVVRLYNPGSMSAYDAERSLFQGVSGIGASVYGGGGGRRSFKKRTTSNKRKSIKRSRSNRRRHRRTTRK